MLFLYEMVCDAIPFMWKFLLFAAKPSQGFGLMFLNEVALGKEHTITSDDRSLEEPPDDCNSVVARGRQEPGGIT